ncbi:DUF3800 domain-containing protein [Patescibacteria group bacterium]|nr:DUF3800 domain-containing protein [Patescibacteria group bacterium]
MNTGATDNHSGKLKLSDYKQIWSPFCFLDESGNLGIKNQPFFTVGMIKCSQPYFLQKAIRNIREKHNYWWEIKFNGLNKVKLKTAEAVIDAFFETQSVKFSSYSLDKRCEYFQKEFHSDPFIAYEQIAKQLIKGNLGKNEILIVLADDLISPKQVKFEVDIKNQINNEFKRLAIAGVCRIDSRANDLLQLTDLLIGSINYELLLKDGVIPKASKNKAKFIKRLKENLGVKNLTSDIRNYKCNIHFHEEDSTECDVEPVNQKGHRPIESTP